MGGGVVGGYEHEIDQDLDRRDDRVIYPMKKTMLMRRLIIMLATNALTRYGREDGRRDGRRRCCDETYLALLLYDVVKPNYGGFSPLSVRSRIRGGSLRSREPVVNLCIMPMMSIRGEEEI